MEELSDAELMEMVKGGDFRAFDQLHSRHAGAVRGFLFSLTWDEDLAEDYLQEVFIRLYRARDRYQPTGKFSTYLFQIAKNYYLTQRRKRRAGEISITQQDRNGCRPFENIRANARVEPEVRLMEDYRRWNIRRAIQALPESQKLVFVMCHIEDMKQADVAEVLGIPVGTVKSRMFAAVSTLRSLLKEDMQ